jgi:methylated-DNA-protein-cysteine methyltransferase related protein
MLELKSRIILEVNKIPVGKVTNYGSIGIKVGCSGLVVGYVLSGMDSSEWDLLPWHRVVAKNGFISSLKLGPKGDLQKKILESEGVEIVEDYVNMSKHFWNGDDSELESIFT